MKNEELPCQAALQSNGIDKETFVRELSLCKRLCRENGGRCNWGVCETCGVIPLLYKLHRGVLLEAPSDIQQARREVRES